MTHEFKVVVSMKDVQQRIEKLIIHGYNNFYYNQPIEQYIEPHGYGYVEKEDEVVEVMVYIENVENVPMQIKYLEELFQCKDVHYTLLKEENWQIPFGIVDLKNGWYLKPPSIEERPMGNIIHFEPPCAFGSGLHGTTQDCLRIILKESFTGKAVLDLGTGSGLLGIAAAIKGATKVVAIDIEEVEREVQYNATLNDVASRIFVQQGNVLDEEFDFEIDVDWIFVNIGGHEIKILQSFLHQHVKVGGHLLLSGMVEWNEEEIIESFLQRGYIILEKAHSEEWVTVLLKKI